VILKTAQPHLLSQFFYDACSRWSLQVCGYGGLAQVASLLPNALAHPLLYRSYIPSVVLERALQAPSTLDAPNSQFVRVQLSGMNSSMQQPADDVNREKSTSRLTNVISRRESDASA
jgi:hypothetical protein